MILKEFHKGEFGYQPLLIMAASMPTTLYRIVRLTGPSDCWEIGLLQSSDKFHDV